MKTGTGKLNQGLVCVVVSLATVAAHSFVINFVDKHPRLLLVGYLAHLRPFWGCCRVVMGGEPHSMFVQGVLPAAPGINVKSLQAALNRKNSAQS